MLETDILRMPFMRVTSLYNKSIVYAWIL